MKVFGIHTGSVHEGGGTIGTLYQNYDKCRGNAIKIVEEKQKEDDNMYQSLGIDTEKTPGLSPTSKWVEKDKDIWTNTIDEVCIVEYDLI